MWKNSKNCKIIVDLNSENMSTFLRYGKKNIASYSFITPNNNFKKFIIYLRTLISSIETYASDNGITLSTVLFNIKENYQINNGKITSCSRLPVLNNVNIEDF